MKKEKEYEITHYMEDIKEWMRVNLEHLPDYMIRPKWVNRELKIDEILKDDDL